MNAVDLPTPTSLRTKKKKRLEALLDARLYLPRLVARLSMGSMTIDDETAARWAGWIDALRDDPAWEFVRPALDMPEAWPEVWTRAREAGFSTATEHHQAIFFTRLFERALDDDHVELARHAWSETLRSWRAVVDDEKFIARHLASSAPDLNDDQRREVVKTLLDGPLAQLGELGIDSLRLRSWESPPARRPLRFLLEALGTARDTFAPSTSPLADGIRRRIDNIDEKLHQSIIEALDRNLDRFDHADADLRDFIVPFEGALLRCRRLRHPPGLDRMILRRGLALIWDLRDAGRDDELGIIPEMVERLEPCAERLRDADDDDFFGLEGAVADLLVFKGEEALSLDDRRQAFEEALEICPGHRNASRLLSYLLLEQANRDLLKTAALPDATARIGPARRRLIPVVERAAERIERAEELYPDNDLLDQYRSDLEGEIERFKFAPSTTTDTRDDNADQSVQAEDGDEP